LEYAYVEGILFILSQRRFINKNGVTTPPIALEGNGLPKKKGTAPPISLKIKVFIKVWVLHLPLLLMMELLWKNTTKACGR
jgi:hypothetical protein